jgi:uncharacterized protein YkwD
LCAAWAAAAVLGSLSAASPGVADAGDLSGALLNEINAVRAANGCGPVSPSPQLTAAAARQAADMLTSGVVGHVGSDGSSVAQRVTDAGYTSYANLGEVVFWGTGSAGTPATAVNWWMNSPGHRAIITNCSLTEAGFAAVSNGYKMTAAVDFGAP